MNSGRLPLSSDADGIFALHSGWLININVECTALVAVVGKVGSANTEQGINHSLTSQPVLRKNQSA